MAAAVEKLSLNALLGLATTPGRDLFARLASYLKLPLASDCVSVDIAGQTVRKSHFSGKTVATIRVRDKTGNVVLGTAYGLASGVVVDTHVGRLSGRLLRPSAM